MLERLKALIEALRDEMKQCGEMLALLEPWGHLEAAETEDPRRRTVVVRTQTTAIDSARQQRERCQRRLAIYLEQPPDAGLAHLIPLLPADYRPLLWALADETEELRVRVDRFDRPVFPAPSEDLALAETFADAVD